MYFQFCGLPPDLSLLAAANAFVRVGRRVQSCYRRFSCYSRPRIAPAIAEDGYILVVLYFIFPSTDFWTSLG